MTKKMPVARRLSFFALIGWAPAALGGAIVLAVLSAALSLAPLALLYWMAVEMMRPAPDLEAVRLLALQALGLILLRWMLMAFSHALAHWGAFSVVYRLRLRLAQRLSRVSMDFFARRGSGALRKTMIDDTGGLEGFLAHMLPDAVVAVVVPLVALTLLFLVDWRLGLASFFPLPLALATQAAMFRRSGERMAQWQALQMRISGQIVEYLRGMPVVKVFGLSARSFGSLAAAIHGAAEWVDRYVRESSAGWSVFVALLTANLVVVAPLAVWLYARGQVDAPTVLLFLLMAPAVLQPLLRLTFVFGEQAHRAQALAEIDAVLHAAVQDDRAGDAPVACDAPHGIEFDRVSFRYPPQADGAADALAGAAALDGISFRAPAGAWTALVGPSGCGKSTILRLLQRLGDVQAGAVSVVGVDVRNWPLDALLQRVSAVFQDVFLFHGSVRDNLLIARPQATPQEVDAATRAAHAYDFITQLPQGYDTLLGERGARLSGGERQRLSIARALLKNTPVLLLDEATAHADAENELLIQRALEVACQGRTVLMVAHRMNTVRHADHIVVLDGGRVVSQGRHDALLSQCAVYQRLWADHEDARRWRLPAMGGNDKLETTRR